MSETRERRRRRSDSLRRLIRGYSLSVAQQLCVHF
jgi:hypothetical protein